MQYNVVIEMIENRFTTVSVPIKTLERLDYIAKITGLSKTKILESFIDCVFAVSVNYSKMAMTMQDEILDNRVVIVTHGIRSSSAITFGKVSNESELRKTIFDRINSDLERKALGLDL